MNEMTPKRKKVVILCAAVACMGAWPVLLRGHPAWMAVSSGLMLMVLVFAFVLVSRLKGSRR